MIVSFKDLSLDLKVLVILDWIVVCIFALAFLIGFIQGVIG